MIKLKLLNKDNLEDFYNLEELLELFQTEVYKSDTKILTEAFINSHYAIYMVEKDGISIGFSSFMVNNYYGLRESTVGNDYIFIKEGFRRTRAMHLISIQAGKVCVESNLPLEHYIASDSSKRLSRKLEGEKIYTTYIYSIEEVKREYDRLRTKIKIKD